MVQNHGWTFRDCRALTMRQVAIVGKEPKDLDEQYRYQQMSPEVRKIADDLKAKQGSF